MKDSIKAGELRCGNWVNSFGKFVQIRSVSNHLSKPHIRYFVSGYERLHSAFIDENLKVTPIPLSKGVLKKIPEFREDNYGLWILYSEYSASVHKPLLWIKWVNAEGGGYWDVCAGEALDKLSNVNHIQNLHELQNIAFAFGKELEITL